MNTERALLLIAKILEECLENEYSAEELRSKIRDMLKLINTRCVQSRCDREIKISYT